MPQGQDDRHRSVCAHCLDQGKDKGALDFAFVFAYQPIVDCARRAVFGHEALVRGPGGESAASILGKVNDGNRYLFDQACRVKAIEGAAALGVPGMLSINFLPNAVYSPEACLKTTFKAARQFNFPIERIIFEVTEGEQVRDRPHLVNIFHEYRRLGFSTAIDDFGAGYAGLTLLAGFPPSIVKLDMELVRDIDTKPAKQAIVRGVLSMCRELGATVLAEGVETAGERDFLYTHGIDLMQGYFFAKPAFQSLGSVDAGAWPAGR